MSARKQDLLDATDVVKWRMCIGCGACVSACRNDKLRMVDIVAEGLRPQRANGGLAGDCSSCSDCLTVCPGVGIAQKEPDPGEGFINELTQSWGPVLEVWEGAAADPDLRRDGSSGGLASAIALFCLEQRGMHGLVHIGPDDESAHLNKTRISRTRAELLATTGSKYAPASPCDHLREIEDAPAPCVFIGKPCDIEAIRKTEAIRPTLTRNLGLAIGIFCAGTPSTQGTLDLLAKYGIDPAQVDELRYRGRGWPGTFAVRMKGETAWRDLATYAEAWGFLQRYRPYRCYLCPDGTSQFADVSCGDPWYRTIEDDETGLSLVVVRTEKGREIVRSAIAAGYVELRAVAPQVLGQSQRELQFKRGAIWGRTVTMRALGIPAPRFSGFSLFYNWLRIPTRDKLRSFIGTTRRVFARGYHRPRQYAGADDGRPPI